MIWPTGPAHEDSPALIRRGPGRVAVLDQNVLQAQFYVVVLAEEGSFSRAAKRAASSTVIPDQEDSRN